MKRGWPRSSSLHSEEHDDTRFVAFHARDRSTARFEQVAAIGLGSLEEMPVHMPLICRLVVPR